ncbi:DUF559 domain-containing protein [Blastococcus sp. CT_GayMR20]|uniref:endonuclease domain-containing protein n=1 Tax=Blastococcus sp. CT_GayMR20 TaxID=2559609 RepID=UPI001073F594|nr:DUF559 domain-containing protein [Blastococcus sp. CT_GayMR20]TFV74264.1 DUF559 domain-containing protein [Blastococcus sp. CT_GayMR20]
MHRLTSLLPHGVARRQDVTRATSSSSVGRWLARGDLVLLHPGVVALPDRAADWPVRAEAACLWAGGPLSHLSALTATGLIAPSSGPLHVTVSVKASPRGAKHVLAHRSDRRVTTIRCGRLEALEPCRSLVDAWAWSHVPRRNADARKETAVVRQVAIEGVRSGDFRWAALRAESDRRPLHPGRQTLLRLLDLLAGGCESELEIWGATRVLPGPPQLPRWVQQHPVRLGDGRWVRLDAAYPEARVAVELDGAAFHGSRTPRERDLRRDSALAALGWVVLRFSFERLMRDPEGCRREIVAVVRGRMMIR